MRPAVAVSRFGFVVGGDIRVANLEAIVADASEAVALLRARSGRRRWSVNEEILTLIIVKVGHKHLERIGQVSVRARLARKD